MHLREHSCRTYVFTCVAVLCSLLGRL